MKNYQLRFDPELISTFLAVSETGRISAAARDLHISQPSVTSHIRQLESTLGVQLFKRSVKGVELTTAGRNFLDRAKQIFSLINETAYVMQKGQEPKGRLVVAASTTIADYVLPSLLAQFKKRYPLISISLVIKNTEEVLECVRQGKAPLGLVEGHARAPSIRLEPFLEDEIVPVVPSAWLGHIRKTSDLTKYPLLVREEGSGTKAVIERGLKKQGLTAKQFKDVIEMGSSASIKSAVAAEMGISFLSRVSIQNEVALGKVATLTLPDFKLTRMFHWALPAGSLTPTAAEFYKFTQSFQRSSFT